VGGNFFIHPFFEALQPSPSGPLRSLAFPGFRLRVPHRTTWPREAIRPGEASRQTVLSWESHKRRGPRAGRPDTGVVSCKGGPQCSAERVCLFLGRGTLTPAIASQVVQVNPRKLLEKARCAVRAPRRGLWSAQMVLSPPKLAGVVAEVRAKNHARAGPAFRAAGRTGLPQASFCGGENHAGVAAVCNAGKGKGCAPEGGSLWLGP